MLSCSDNSSDAKSSLWACLFPIVLIGAIPLVLFRLHIIGTTTFIGNSDRLNSFLNILRFYTQSFKDGQLAAWNDSMLTGINTFALPYTFPNPLVILETAVSQQALLYMAGIVSCLLLSVAGWAAYSAIRAFGVSRHAAFIGAALYQCSALSVLKVSQNDMSFAVLIVIPLMMREIRCALGDASAWSFARLSVILSCLLWFMFLQKAAYALLLGGGYALTLARREQSWRPLAIFGGGVVVAIASASPRLYSLGRELRLLDRTTPGVDPNSFDQLYEFQNVRWYELFRWLDDGVFGRFPAEAAALGNGINLTEGMLLYTTVFAAFVVLFVLVRFRSQWFAIPLCRAGDASFCFYAFAISCCVVLVKPVGAILYYVFLKLDFTHARILVAGLFPLCALISFALDDLRPSGEPADEEWNVRPLALWVIPVLCGLAVLLGFWRLTLVRVEPGVVMTSGQVASGGSTHVQEVRKRAKSVMRVWMRTGSVIRIAMAAACVSGVFLWVQFARRHHAARRVMPLLLGAAMVCDAVLSADFQMNGKHVRSSDAVPFIGGNILQAKADEFVPPSPGALASLKRALETDQYRSVTVCDPHLFPAGCAAYLSTFWDLRLVDGYSSGVPRVLAVLPWPPGIHHLRDVTFPTAQGLPWNVLALLNVKYAVVVNEGFYKNRIRAGGDIREATASDIETLKNPLPITPRVFFVQRVEPIADAAEAVGKLFGGRTSVAPEQISFVEGLEAPGDFSAGGQPHASFKRDQVDIDLESSPEPRFLVLNERPHPNWHAYAQEYELPIYSTNVVMRGILVPPGVTHVSLRFEPFGLSRFWVLFPIGSVVLAILGVLVLSRTAKQYGKSLAVPRPE